MATKSPNTDLVNEPNYYWAQALEAFDRNKIDDCHMYLFLFYMSTLGEF